ncbi:MAG: DUF192 domain-containing protein [Euryarchaeota archaeon]|nr:DUF192 domain-containing protein [Euryarchaeota archaeon]
MIVYNAAKSIKICEAKEASNFLSRVAGLMFREKLEQNKGLLIKFFPGSSSVHSFFMRFPIDLIFISKDLRVVDLKTLKPWRIYSPKKQCKWVLEVNEGIIKKKGIEIGDLLEFS